MREYRLRYEHSEHGLARRREGKGRRREIARQPGSMTDGEWDDLKTAFDHCCAYCGTRPKHLQKDHVVPVSRGGDHSVGNIVPACNRCNVAKADRTPAEWGVDIRPRKGSHDVQAPAGSETPPEAEPASTRAPRRKDPVHP